MSTATNLTTADELLQMSADGARRELVRGEIRTLTPAGYEHGAVVMELGRLIANHVRQHRLGTTSGAETGFLISRNPDTVRAPDVAFVSQARIAVIGKPKGYFPGPPDLAIEVLSPHDQTNEVEEKTRAWLAAGVKEVWNVNPMDQTVSIFESSRRLSILTGLDSLESPTLLPGFRCRVSELFG